MAKSKSNPGSNGSTQNLEKVRELLLGSDRRETEDRITRAERALRAEIKSARTEASRAIRELGKGLRADLAELGALIESEARERSEGEGAQLDRIEAAKKTLRNRIDRVEADSKQRARSLRERVSASSRKLREELQASEAKALERIQTEIDALYAHGMPKQRLSALLAELAERVAASERD